MKRIILLITCLFLLSSTCLASNWRHSDDTDSYTRYIDVDSICYAVKDGDYDRNIIRYWTEIHFKPGAANGYAMEYCIINRKEKTRTIGGTIYLDDKLQQVGNDDKPYITKINKYNQAFSDYDIVLNYAKSHDEWVRKGTDNPRPLVAEHVK